MSYIYPIIGKLTIKKRKFYKKIVKFNNKNKFNFVENEIIIKLEIYSH